MLALDMNTTRNPIQQEQRIYGGGQDISERFWNRVDKSGDCWEWTGAKSHGYGALVVGGRSGAVLRAHRVALLLSGVWIGRLHVDHMCSNPGCVRPDHLRVVTIKQNLEHVSASGRVDNHTGHRGVAKHKQSGGYQAYVTHHGERQTRHFMQLADAVEWVQAKRAELYTHEGGC